MMRILDAWIDEPVPLVVCAAHAFEPLQKGLFRCVQCGRVAEDG